MAGKEIVRLSPDELNDPINLTPNLVKIPGWVAMSEQRREWLRNETAAALGEGRKAAMHTVMFCVRVARIEEGLRNEPVTFVDWATTVFAQSWQTVRRALERYRKMRELAPEEAILDLANHGLPGMQGMQVGRIITAMKQLPPPKDATNPKKMAEYRVRLTEQLRNTFREAKAGKEEKIDRQDAMKLMCLHVRLMIKKAGLKSSREKIAFIGEGLSYLLDREAISGAMTVKRKPAPEDWWPKVGYPKGKKRKKAA